MKTGSFTDQVDGKSYKTVKIGNQVWMAENLNTSKYKNGDSIPEISDEEEWGQLSAGGCCAYNNDVKNQELYGRLYNWHAVNDPRGLAPEGWHIPSEREWRELEMYLGMNPVKAGKTGWRGDGKGGVLKEKGILHWHAPNEGATNESGFTGLPGGYRDVNGLFYVNGYSGYWWSSTEKETYFAWYRTLYYTHNEIHRATGYEGDGFSVRCIKNI